MAEPHPLRAWRTKHKKTLSDMGDRVGVGASHISQIETGDKMPSLQLAAKLSDVTGIPLGKFVKQEASAE